MAILIDTGILLRYAERSDPRNTEIRVAIRHLKQRGVEIVTTQQNVAEFWNVSTRPATARGGFGLDLAETNRRRRVIERLFRIGHPSASAYRIWTRLIVDHSVSGVQVHDARLVAFMEDSKIADVMTLNPADFRRYPGIRAHDPSVILAAFP